MARERGVRVAEDGTTGVGILHDPRLNKGTAFTKAERDRLGLHGLLPPRVFTPDEQEVRVLRNYHEKTSDLEKYIFLTALQDRNETLFYRLVMNNVEEMLPIIYTPTVGEACKLFGHIFRRARGLYITAEDQGKIEAVLRNWPESEIDVIVVTDGARILGLGDLGAHGMGIPVGKLNLYSALAGIHPARCLPITIDVGTDNEELRNDPLYIGLVQERITGTRYEELIDEFVDAVQEVFPDAVLQFEDFATRNAIGLLKKYRDDVRTFNDDIQGTAAVTLAGLYSSSRITGIDLTDQTVLFYGAGAAATGIAGLIASAMAKEGMDPDDAKRRSWFIDSKGLVVSSREDLPDYKREFAHDQEFLTGLEEIIRAIKPTALIGVSGQPQRFDEGVIRAMGEINDEPVIFALSNPTAKSECTAEQAYRWSDGKAIFASGSPFPPYESDGRTLIPGQGNNAYIFPGLGLGVIASKARLVTDEMFAAAAKALAEECTEECLRHRSVYPPMRTIRKVSHSIAVAVAEEAYSSGLAEGERAPDIKARVRDLMYQPEYPMYA